MKQLSWVGSSKDDFMKFPNPVVRDLGYQLHLLQMGNSPDDMKPLKGLGKGITGVYEIRDSFDGDTFRIEYITKLADSIVVLHSWQKKTEKTARPDIKLIVERYKVAREALP